MLARNAVLERLGGQHAYVGDAMAAFTDCDAGLVYRLSRSAARLGFALERVFCRHANGSAYVAVSKLDDDRLLWRIISPERLADAVLPAISHRYEAAPFAYLRLPESGEPTANARFRELFGDQRAEVIETLKGEQGALLPGRYRLATQDGRERLMRAFVPSPRDGEADANLAAQAHHEVFLFDLMRDEALESDAVGDLDDVPAAMTQILSDGTILWLNAAARRTFGPAAEPGQNLGDMIQCRGRPLAGLMEEARGAPGEGRAEMVYASGDVAERPLQITLMPSSADGGQTLLAVLNDASELQALQDKYAQSQ
ncbi:MAG: hypothetical protein AAF968_03320, partial [Pseudomonadota bacterium]